MKITRSLRWRIQLWHGAFLLVLLVVLGIAAYQYERQQILRRTDDELAKRLALVFDSLPTRGEGRRPPPGEGGPDGFRPPPERGRRDGPPPEIRMSPQAETFFANGFHYVVWGRSNEVLHHSENLPDGIPVPVKQVSGEPDTMRRLRGEFREAYLFTPPGDCILVGRSMLGEREALRRYGMGLFGVEGVILALGLGGGWWMTSRSLRPLAAIGRTAEDVSEGHLDRRVNLPPDDGELGQLAARLDETFAKLEAAFERQARFTSDAAHELRTPLSVVISQAQLALRGERDGTEYREMFQATLRGARRMQSLTQSLLELARIDNDGGSADRRPCDLATLAADAISSVRNAASEKGVTLRTALSSAPCTGDAESLTRLIINLLNNAIEHGGDHSAITVTTAVSEDGATLSVADEGPGIGAEHLPHLFERFYRVDRSRTRGTGGSGLGLAICKGIIDSHGGTINVSSVPGEGSVFSFSVPEKISAPPKRFTRP